MFAALAAGFYGMYERRIQNKVLVSLCYFLTMGLLWAAVTFVIAWMATARDIARRSIDPGFFSLVPLVGFALGLIFAFFSWITGLHSSGDKKE